MNEPLLIVLSSTRNYGWVTRAFLEGNSRWADYIVIVDQMSTDGTREMCAEYGEKVIIVDDPDMAYKESTRSIMAFNKGREIAGNRDHIFFALDIDEVMPANWMDTSDGQRIINSKPGDEFSIHWANINPDKKTYFADEFTNPWNVQYKVLHDDSNIVFNESGSQMHVPLLPYVNYDVPPYIVNDFLLLHFGHYNTEWNEYKGKFYQIQDIRQKRSKHFVRLCRMYCGGSVKHVDLPIKQEWLFQDWDIFESIDTEHTPIFVEYIKEILQQDGIKQYAKLNIWSDELCRALMIDNPNKWYHRLFHSYINKTQKNKYHLHVKIIDKFLDFNIENVIRKWK